MSETRKSTRIAQREGASHKSMLHAQTLHTPSASGYGGENTSVAASGSIRKTTTISSTTRKKQFEAERALALARENIKEAEAKAEKAKARKALIEAEYEAKLITLEAEEEQRLSSGRAEGSIQDWADQGTDYVGQDVNMYGQGERDELKISCEENNAQGCAVTPDAPSDVQILGDKFNRDAPRGVSRESDINYRQEPIVMNTGVEGLTEAFTKVIRLVQGTTPPPDDRLVGRMALKALPVFSGDSREWLTFKRAYECSTDVGKFTDKENMVRLHECLQGKAKEAIGLRLLTDDDPKSVMHTLEIWFGKPKKLFDELIAEIKKVQPSFIGQPVNMVLLATRVHNYVTSVKAMGKMYYLHNEDLAQNIIGKFSELQLRMWNNTAKKYSSNEPKLSILASFLNDEAERAADDDCFEGIKEQPQMRPEIRQPLERNYSELRRPYRQDRPHHTVFATSEEQDKIINSSQCLYCFKRHHVTECHFIKKLAVNERWIWARRKGVCFKCFSGRHLREKCRARSCGKCHRSHHSLLHEDMPINHQPPRNMEEDGPGQSRAEQKEVITNTWTPGKGRLLLKVVPVRLEGPKGVVQTFALLDDGSTVSLIDEEIATKIGAEGPKDKLRLQGAHGMVSADSNSRRVSFKISGKNLNEYIINNVRTVASLSLPAQTISREEVDCHPHLADLPIETYDGAKPSLLIGQDNWQLMFTKESRYITKNAPVGARTNLGWTLHGYAQLQSSLEDINDVTLHLKERDEELHARVKEYFQLENMGVLMKNRRNSDEERALDILKKTTRKISHNRWETGLLWKKEVHAMPNNKEYAMKRLRTIERKMDR